MVIRDVAVGAAEDGYLPVTLDTSRGSVACRYYPAAGSHRAAVWVGGVGGGWDTPARGLYPRLCADLVHEGIASLRVRFRHPTILEEAVLDVLAGLSYLEAEGIAKVALTGHSFGGAVVIQAAAASPLVRTVVALATQSYGTDVVRDLAPRCAVLLIHGTHDQVLAPINAELVYRLAGEPKQVVLLEGAGHVLDEAAQEVYRSTRAWILRYLDADVPRAGHPA